MFRRRLKKPLYSPHLRPYSSPSEKPPLKLVAQLRQLTEVSITKAREALSATNNDIRAALDWLQQDLAVSGAKRAAKLESRVANEGLIGVCVLSNGTGAGRGAGHGGIRASMVELNCETDFVGRNTLFARLLTDIAHTVAFISDTTADSENLLTPCSLEMLHEAPLIPHSNPVPSSSITVSSAIRASMATLGEKISLRRAITVVRDPISSRDLGLRVASHIHGTVGLPSQGRIGSLALLAMKSRRLSELLPEAAFMTDLEKLERSLGRQIIGLDTRMIRSPPGTKDETALYEQPFLMSGDETQDGSSVKTVLQRWAKERNLVSETDGDEGLEVLEFAKWTVGEGASSSQP